LPSLVRAAPPLHSSSPGQSWRRDRTALLMGIPVGPTTHCYNQPSPNRIPRKSLLRVDLFAMDVLNFHFFSHVVNHTESLPTVLWPDDLGAQRSFHDPLVLFNLFIVFSAGAFAAAAGVGGGAIYTPLYILLFGLVYEGQSVCWRPHFALSLVFLLLWRFFWCGRVRSVQSVFGVLVVV